MYRIARCPLRQTQRKEIDEQSEPIVKRLHLLRHAPASKMQEFLVSATPLKARKRNTVEYQRWLRAVKAFCEHVHKSCVACAMHGYSVSRKAHLSGRELPVFARCAASACLRLGAIGPGGGGDRRERPARARAALRRAPVRRREDARPGRSAAASRPGAATLAQHGPAASAGVLRTVKERPSFWLS